MVDLSTYRVFRQAHAEWSACRVCCQGTDGVARIAGCAVRAQAEWSALPGVLSGHRRSDRHAGCAEHPTCCAPAPLPDQAQPVFFQSWQPDVMKYASEALIVTTAVPFTLLFAMIESVECSASLTRSQ